MSSPLLSLVRASTDLHTHVPSYDPLTPLHPTLPLASLKCGIGRPTSRGLTEEQEACGSNTLIFPLCEVGNG